jgi:hypothetical protein
VIDSSEPCGAVDLYRPDHAKDDSRRLLKQDIAFRLDRFELGLFAEHDPHLDLDSPRNR